MKKVIVAIVILSVIVVAGVLEACYIDKVFDELDSRLADMENAIKADDGSALEVTRDLTQWWNRKRRYLELFTYSPDIRAFSVALAEAEGSLECDDNKNAMSKCQSLISMSSNLHSILDFNAADII